MEARVRHAAREASRATPSRAAELLLQAVSDGLGADGGALLLMDPRTWLFTTGAIDRLPAASCHPFFQVELGSGSRRTFRRLAETGAGASLLAESPDDRFGPDVLVAHGFGDELRAVCRDAGAVWGGLTLWRRADSSPFTSTDVAAVDRVTDLVGRALRDAVLRSLGPGGEGPGAADRGVIVLDGGRVVEMSADAAGVIRELDDPQLTEYRHLDHLRALAGRTPRFSTMLGTEDGRWLTAHGTPLDGDRVAVVLTVATPGDLFGTVVMGNGLTPREAEVTRLLCRGLSDAEIARTLHVSPHTAHDHVRAVRSKLRVRNRSEVAAKVFAERYLDGFLGSAAITHLP